MIIIQTVYPCVACGREIAPTHEHCEYCEYCGAKQPELTGRTQFNVFSRPVGWGSYHMKYGGDPILTLEDGKDVAAQTHVSNDYECFLGAYIIGQGKSTSESGMELPIVNWMPIVNGEVGEDEGPCTIYVSFLERI